MFKRRPLDSKELLADVKRETIIKALQRSKGGLPRAIQFTNKPIEEAHLANMLPHDKAYLCQLYGRIREEPLSAIPELLTLQARCPNVPTIANYLSIAYLCNQQKDRHLALLSDTRERFPDYLFGKISLAEYYLNRQEHTRVPNILERKFEIWQHCPNVKVFHVSEIRSFFSVLGSYFARCNKIARALYHYCILVDIEPEHHATKRVGDEIILKELNKMI